jgi:HlyD family secretion protein
VNKISSLRQQQENRGMSVSGQGMDRQIERKTPVSRIVGLGVAGILALLFVWWLVTALLGGRSLSVDSQRISVAEVSVGTFEDFIPLRGRLVPRSTVYLDAVEGGRVERVLLEDGAIVEAGDPIVLLSNTNLQLEVLGREAAVTEQLNFMRTLELQLEQNRLSHKRNLVEIDYQITRLTRSIQRQSELAERDLVSQSTLDELQDELDYYRNRREVTIESQATDARLQEEQLRQLRSAGSQLETSLAFARKNIDDLNVRAPVAGKLSGFNVERTSSMSASTSSTSAVSTLARPLSRRTTARISI